MERSVWLIARPIQFATIFGFQFVSHGKYPFCHWAVLVTSLDFETIKAALTDSATEKDDIQLGDLWRISPRDDGKCPLDNIRPFCVSNAKDEWSVFSAEYIGKTSKSDNEIGYEAMRIVHEKPDYNKVGKDCQNFTKYFVDAISPGALRPETIKTIIERFVSPVKVPPSLVSASWGFGSYLNPSDNPISPLPSPLAEQFPFHSPNTSYETPLHVRDEDLDDVAPEEVKFLVSGVEHLEVR